MADTKTARAAGQRDWCVCCCHPVLTEVAAIPFISQSLWEIATSEERTGTQFEGNISNITSPLASLEWLISKYQTLIHSQLSPLPSLMDEVSLRAYFSIWSHGPPCPWHLRSHTPLFLFVTFIFLCRHFSLILASPCHGFHGVCLSVALSASIISSTSKAWNTISFLSLNIAFLISFLDSRCIYYRSSCWPHGWKPTDAN